MIKLILCIGLLTSYSFANIAQTIKVLSDPKLKSFAKDLENPIQVNEKTSVFVFVGITDLTTLNDSQALCACSSYELTFKEKIYSQDDKGEYTPHTERLVTYKVETEFDKVHKIELVAKD